MIEWNPLNNIDYIKKDKIEGDDQIGENQMNMLKELINRDNQAMEMKENCETLKKDRLYNEYTPNMDVWEKR